MSDRFILAQISDTHVRADDGAANAARLKQALAEAGAYRPHAILLTGDLVNDEREDEYAALASALGEAPAPVFLMPGNHDHRDRLRAAFPAHRYLPKDGPLSFALDDFPVRVVAVDQIVPGATHGEFSPEQAAWLDATLKEVTYKPTIVALHHPPFLTHDRLFDRIGLEQDDRFAAVIARHPQVVRILCGHRHRTVVGQVAHAPVVACPSTAYVYGVSLREDQPIGVRTDEALGWMLHVWSARGGLASIVMGL
jgi:3',5'-cyclic AMP phosphodiesterase CpdA